MYRTLLFDVDDTLLDFKAGELRALRDTFAHFQLPYTPAIEAAYLQINAGLWQQYEAGKISRSQIFSRRFGRLFKQFGLVADAAAVEHRYHQQIDETAILLPRVVETLDALGDYQLYVTSNGVEPVQLSRLTQAGLIDYFADVFVSDSIGAPKPTRAFFDYVAKHVPHFEPATTLIIGDSLTSDIQGGINARIDSVWFNPHLLPNRTAITPVYQLSDFSDLTRIAGAD